ncbi:vesicle-associated membrane protein 3 isoform X2 [Columba livia]|uniref:vesicle-associated membrane protein 3 isoform X2 n=1 Tax=Columba livia TaxID=8932 RepID=UPI0031B9F954
MGSHTEDGQQPQTVCWEALAHRGGAEPAPGAGRGGRRTGRASAPPLAPARLLRRGRVVAREGPAARTLSPPAQGAWSSGAWLPHAPPSRRRGPPAPHPSPAPRCRHILAAAVRAALAVGAARTLWLCRSDPARMSANIPGSSNVAAGSNRRLQQTQHQVDEVVDIMRVNVDKVLERDQKLSELDDRADALQAGASQFETSAAKLKRKYWWKNCKS